MYWICLECGPHALGGVHFVWVATCWRYIEYWHVLAVLLTTCRYRSCTYMYIEITTSIGRRRRYNIIDLISDHNHHSQTAVTETVRLYRYKEHIRQTQKETQSCGSVFKWNKNYFLYSFLNIKLRGLHLSVLYATWKQTRLYFCGFMKNDQVRIGGSTRRMDAKMARSRFPWPHGLLAHFLRSEVERSKMRLWSRELKMLPDP